MIDGYPELLQVIRGRIRELGVPYATIDAIAGFSDRYTSKIMRGEKRLTMTTMFALLGTIALYPRMEADEARLSALRKRGDWIARRRTGPQYMPRDSQIDANASALSPRHSGRRSTKRISDDL
jgi:hypothetical protein